TVASQVSFASVGIWWFVFSIPLFKNIHEEKKTTAKREHSYMKIGFTRVISTFKEIKRYKQLLIFLFAFWLYNVESSTIIKIACICGRAIGIDSFAFITAFLIMQFVGIPCTFFFGWLIKKITANKALSFSLYIYLGIVILGH